MKAATASAAALVDREFVERVAAIYKAAVGSGWGSVAVALCLILVMGRFIPTSVLLAWFGLTLFAISFRIPLIRGYRADPDRDARARIWARRYLWMISGIGSCWALASFLMIPKDDPFALASFLMVIALFGGGVIASQSYLLPVASTFLSLVILPAALRLVSFWELRYVPMAVTLCLFYLFLLAYARTQSRQIGEAIQLKHQNDELVTALQVEKAQAEEARQHAEQANLAKTRFLAAASHDLRQPMHALGLFSASLQEMRIDPEKRAVVDNIFASIDALESLFVELLDLSRLEAGFTKPQPRHLLLADVFTRVRAQYTPIAAAKPLDLSVNAGDAVALADAALLERMLGNLVANAIQYTPGGSVTMTARMESDGVVVSVSDTGPGISEEHRERVFEEFFQIGNPERDRRKGLGLGLAIVRRIATLTGTPLQLHSEVGRGSRFELVLPLGDAAQVQPDDAVEPSTGTTDILHGRSILIVDDERSVRDGMATLLERWGCSPIPAASCSEALSAVQTSQPDLIVADLRLRDGSSGIETIDAVRQAMGRQLPALIITGDTTMEAIRQVTQHSLPLLHKPVRPVRLRAALSQLLVN